MNTIDSVFGNPIGPIKPDPPGRKKGGVDKTYSEQQAREMAKVEVTEKNVTEVVFRMDLLGLDYKKISSVEKKIDAAGRAGKGKEGRAEKGKR